MARSLSFASAISATSPVLFDVGAEATADTDVDLCGEGSPPAPARPRTAAEELDDLVGGYLSLDKLEKETGCDPRLAKTIVLKVDTRLTSISSLGKQLPSLEQFKLNNSFVPSIRDLGSGYNALRILWMARCSLNDLSGLGSLANLRELYLANNNIFDTSPIGMLEYLEILDLEGNKIASDEMIEELAVCENLVELSLEGNPVCGGLSDDSTDRDSRKSFQEYVQSILPNICVLNDEILHTDGALLHKISALQAKRPMTSLDRPLSHAEEPASLMDDTSALGKIT
ncbi:Leucine-rich repeat-containing protein 56 [Entophlyctis luteolus]|nr:Leucine-rich repeat-containing protein 56 [Entophlyctis luteolus]KAJ3388910.1 Leucine-rich repeat-containing protein 56 [Entophlyctis sp. JEL0112]